MREERLYGASEGGAKRLELHPAFRGASHAISAVAPGVYEGLRTFGKERFFGLRSHMERLADSVAGFKTPLAFDEEAFIGALEGAARDATSGFGDAEVRIRIDVAAAPGTDLGCPESNVLIAATPFRGLPDHILAKGAYLRTAPGLQRPDPAVKTSDFIALREAWIEAHGDPEAYEHVMLSPEGHVLEGTQSNVVLVRDGAIHVAPRGILPGVTLRAVCDLARDAGIEVVREFVPLDDIASFDEAFMTTSVRSVVPVTRIDGVTFQHGGPVTRALAAAYDALAEEDAVVPARRAEARY